MMKPVRRVCVTAVTLAPRIFSGRRPCFAMAGNAASTPASHRSSPPCRAARCRRGKHPTHWDARVREPARHLHARLRGMSRQTCQRSKRTEQPCPRALSKRIPCAERHRRSRPPWLCERPVAWRPPFYYTHATDGSPCGRLRPVSTCVSCRSLAEPRQALLVRASRPSSAARGSCSIGGFSLSPRRRFTAANPQLDRARRFTAESIAGGMR
jgi:hypothetical protein